MSKESAAAMARSGKTFYRAAQLLPAESREAVMQLYRFCRLVDDLADESLAPVSSRLAGLKDLQYALQIQGNEAVLDCFGWSEDLAHRLGNTRSAAALLVRTAAGDLRFEQPADLAQLEQYAFGVAGTVGLMLCNLLGARSEGRASAVHLGIAMQCSNIARDVTKDLSENRVYLPATWIPAAMVQQAVVHRNAAACAQLESATHQLLAVAELHYRIALDGIWTLPWRVRWSILAATLCYREIGLKVGHDVSASWERRTVVSPACKAWLTLSAALHLLLPRFWKTAPLPSLPQSLKACL